MYKIYYIKRNANEYSELGGYKSKYYISGICEF